MHPHADMTEHGRCVVYFLNLLVASRLDGTREWRGCVVQGPPNAERQFHGCCRKRGCGHPDSVVNWRLELDYRDVFCRFLKTVNCLAAESLKNMVDSLTSFVAGLSGNLPFFGCELTPLFIALPG